MARVFRVFLPQVPAESATPKGPDFRPNKRLASLFRPFAAVFLSFFQPPRCPPHHLDNTTTTTTTNTTNLF